MTDLLVIGGGAAGLMAAGAACAKGLTVTVLEHNPKGPGQKLLITGKGRCNLTSDSDVREFLPYVRHNGRFLYSSLYAFPPSAAMELFESLGVPLKTERGNRVFPVSDRSHDIANALERAYAHAGGRVLHAAATDILTRDGAVSAVVTTEGTIDCGAAVVCTGGMSVDPDDTTPSAIKQTGAEVVSYGAPVLPGAMFLLAYTKDGKPIMGLPGCVMYAKRTIFDLVLPRVMADVPVTKADLAKMGAGGLCLNCPTCIFPNCGFGK